MRDEILERAILTALLNRLCGAKERTLRNEVAILVDRPLMTVAEFSDAVGRLVARGAVSMDATPLGGRLWRITPAGMTMMAEEGWV